MPSTDALSNLRNKMSAFTELNGAIGAIDGCHVPIQLPFNCDGRSFYNFKGFYSSLMVVMCDYNYRIIGYSIGHTGCQSDSSIVLVFYVDKAF